MGGKFDIYIIKVGSEYLVRPAVAAIDGSTKKLNIRNLTDYSADLHFPPNFLDNNTNSISVSPKDAGTAHLRAGLNDHYPYTVTMNTNEGMKDARGESAPSVIVDP